MPRHTPETDIAKLQRRQAAEAHLIYKLRLIRALHIAAYNSPSLVEKVSVELFYALGDVLEGLKINELKLTLINREEVAKEMDDDG